MCEHVDMTYEDAKKKFQECLHIAVVQNIANNIDGVYGISPQLDFEGQLLLTYQYYLPNAHVMFYYQNIPMLPSIKCLHIPRK